MTRIWRQFFICNSQWWSKVKRRAARFILASKESHPSSLSQLWAFRFAVEQIKCPLLGRMSRRNRPQSAHRVITSQQPSIWKERSIYLLLSNFQSNLSSLCLLWSSARWLCEYLTPAHFACHRQLWGIGDDARQTIRFRLPWNWILRRQHEHFNVPWIHILSDIILVLQLE